MPDFGELTIKLLLVAFPGLIASRLYRKLKGRRVRQTWEDVAEVLVFSVLAYMVSVSVWWVVHVLTSWALPVPAPATPFSTSTLDARTGPDWVLILLTAPVGAGLGLLAALIERYQLGRAMAKRLGGSSSCTSAAASAT